jgi:hypothetical protein
MNCVGAWSLGEFAFGILVNVVSALLIFVIAWAALYVSRHHRLIEFFNARERGITLYTSTLNVRQFGSTDEDGVPRSFSGPAIPLAEARTMAEFERMLSTYAFGRLAVLRRLQIVGVDYQTESAPATVDLVDRHRTLLTLGSPGYNTASQLVEQDFEPLGHFNSENGRVVVTGAPRTTVWSGMLLRAVHPTTGQVAFYAAGPSEAATVEAARYLLQNWATLRRDYGSRDSFCIVIEASPKGGSTVIHRTPHRRAR